MIPMEPSATQVADPRNAATGNAVAAVAANGVEPPVETSLTRTQERVETAFTY
jgi:hypothetical protein